MIDPELNARIRRYFYAEHWRTGTIAAELGIHPDTVRRALDLDRPQRAVIVRPSKLDPYLDFIRRTLDQHPNCAPHASTSCSPAAAMTAA